VHWLAVFIEGCHGLELSPRCVADRSFNRLRVLFKSELISILKIRNIFPDFFLRPAHTDLRVALGSQLEGFLPLALLEVKALLVEVGA